MDNKKKCIKCDKEKNINSSFYKSEHPLHADGRIPVCKECLNKMVDINNIQSVYDTLKLIDKPFMYDVWNTSVEESQRRGIALFGTYIKNANMPQYRGYTWENSVFEKENNENVNITEEKNKKKKEIEITDELEEKWGIGYTPEEYVQFEKKYRKLEKNYGEKTAFHTENLLTYIRYRVKEELSTASGNVKEAKEWGQLAAKAATDAKINVSQLSKSDISGGVDVVSQLFEAVESEVGIIPHLPQLMEQPYDDADLIIWATINYNRRLEDKPKVAYRDIWNFYDEMLTEYFNQQGFNSNQINEFKKKRNNVFRDLEKVYKEPLYEGDE